MRTKTPAPRARAIRANFGSTLPTQGRTWALVRWFGPAPHPSAPEQVLATSADNRAGIIAMLSAMALFTGNDIFLKLSSDFYAPSQIMIVRSVFATLVALVLVAVAGAGRALATAFRPILLLRAALEAGAAYTFISAIGSLPLALITAILQATPLMMTLMMVALGIARVGWRRWSAICVGFAGVLLVVRPSTAGVDSAVLNALACAALVAIRDILTRRIATDVPSAVIAFTTTVTVGLTGLGLALAEGVHDSMRPLQPLPALYLLGAAVFATLGNYCVIAAFRRGDAEVVGVFRYSVILWAILAGWVVWGDLPDLVAAAGIALIVASGIYTIHRERVREREAAVTKEDGTG